MEGEERAGHTSLPGVELISPPFVPGERFKHPPKPLPLLPGNTRQLHLKVQIQPLSLFLFALQLLFGEDGDNPLCHRHTHTRTHAQAGSYRFLRRAALLLTLTPTAFNYTDKKVVGCIIAVPIPRNTTVD